MRLTIALDAGTTGVRALCIDEAAQVVDLAYRELTQSYPAPGWVEHDAAEIWRLSLQVLGEVASRVQEQGHDVVALGITNQRETVVAWDRSTSTPLAPAIVWQDRRSATRCSELEAAGHLDEIRRRTGLVLDPYFSATKMEWLLNQGIGDGVPSLSLGTVDAWLVWNLTGTFATDASNASRTMLFDLDAMAWSPELCHLFSIPLDVLPEIFSSNAYFGEISHPELDGLAGVPVHGVLGDQQAALFGQACFESGMVKATYGTGAFVVANAGTTRPPLLDGLLTSVAWTLDATTTYAHEGSAFIAGAAIQWLRDELGILDHESQLESLACSVASSDGLSFIPAFVGLGSPWWDDAARGALVGITRGSTRAHLARAVLDSLAFEVRAMTDAMGGASVLHEIRVDGGAAVMDALLAQLADQTRCRVTRPESLETTAIGAALLAGLGTGHFASLDDVAERWKASASFDPVLDVEIANANYRTWLDALERARSLTA
jgi:glycerol kinase